MAKYSEKENYLLRKYYETEINVNNEYDIPFEFLFNDELELLYRSWCFSIFRLRENISSFISKVASALKIN